MHIIFASFGERKKNIDWSFTHFIAHFACAAKDWKWDDVSYVSEIGDKLIFDKSPINICGYYL